jgi:hypothetical protein
MWGGGIFVLRTIRSWSTVIAIAFPVGKAARARSWPLTLSIAQVENDWSYTSTRITWREQERHYLIWLATFPAHSAYKDKFVSFSKPWRHMGEWSYKPMHLNLGTTWWWTVSFTPGRFFAENNTRFPLDKSQGGPQSWSWCFRLIKYLLACRESKHDSLDL